MFHGFWLCVCAWELGVVPAQIVCAACGQLERDLQDVLDFQTGVCSMLRLQLQAYGERWGCHGMLRRQQRVLLIGSLLCE